jgi:hypothetical protein
LLSDPFGRHGWASDPLTLAYRKWQRAYKKSHSPHYTHAGDQQVSLVRNGRLKRTTSRPMRFGNTPRGRTARSPSNSKSDAAWLHEPPLFGLPPILVVRWAKRSQTRKSRPVDEKRMGKDKQRRH